MLKRMFGSTLLGVFVALAGLAAMPAAAQKNPVPLLLCPAGCGPTESDTILMVQMIKEGMPVTLLPQESPGYMYNIREMKEERNWKRTLFSTEDVLIQLAMKWGGTPEIKEFLPEAIPIRTPVIHDPVASAPQIPQKAPISIIPSRPMFTTPLRSEKRPPSDA